jgi:DNA topoisomerase VI subunit B
MAPQAEASSHAKSKKRSLSSSKKESQESKSPAEFFAEHQAIAGFDNLGKSLYTTVRELVENALDACEAIQQLPDVHIHIQEYNVDEFNRLRTSDIALTGQEECSSSRKDATGGDRAAVAAAGPTAVVVPSSPRSPSIVVDAELYKAKSPKKRKRDKEEGETEDKGPAEGVDDDGTPNTKSTNNHNKKRQTLTPNNKASSMQYFLVTVSDNGCGMEHAAIPNLFGRVLSGRWTRHMPGPMVMTALMLSIVMSLMMACIVLLDNGAPCFILPSFFFGDR